MSAALQQIQADFLCLAPISARRRVVEEQNRNRGHSTFDGKKMDQSHSQSKAKCLFRLRKINAEDQTENWSML